MHNGTSAVDIGFVANKLLHDLKHKKKKISDKDFYSVKAPIRCGLVRNLAWLHPLDISVVIKTGVADVDTPVTLCFL